MSEGMRGRGARGNPPGRFARTRVEPDAARSVISRNDSRDVPFGQSINPYRGCEHGCIYCYARASHACLGLSPGLDFETRLYYKRDAAELLRAELARPGYVCTPLALGANTDPYQPIEARLRVTRSILGVLLELRHPCTIVTKGVLVLRDLDLLAAHVMALVRAMRGGSDNDPRFDARMRGSGPIAGLLARRFELACRRHGVALPGAAVLDTAAFRTPRAGGQLDLAL